MPRREAAPRHLAQSDSMTINFAASTTAGRVRPTNQDDVAAVAGSRPGTFLFAVADGVGGLAEGAEASHGVIAALTSAFEGDAIPLSARVSTQILEANAALHGRGLASGQPVGTTIVVVTIEDGSFEVLHVGDSRAYLLRETTLLRLTEDHSWVAEQVRAGVLTEQEASNSPHRNVITRCLGVEPDVTIERRGPEPCLAGDTFLLCSDGLHGLVADAQIRDVLRRTDPPEALARSLVDMANDAGGTDNISVVVAHVERA